MCSIITDNANDMFPGILKLRSALSQIASGELTDANSFYVRFKARVVNLTVKQCMGEFWDKIVKPEDWFLCLDALWKKRDLFETV